jgi:hypothetical protein
MNGNKKEMVTASYWKIPLLIKQHRQIQKRIEKKGGILKKGTILYHGSLVKGLKFIANGRSVFFGLNPLICLAYLGEQLSTKQFTLKNIPKGYLYKYKLRKNIPFYHAKNINKHPFENNYEAKCTNKIACVHPQITIRYKLKRVKRKIFGDNIYSTVSDMRTTKGDLAIEVTIPDKHFNKLEEVSVSEVDIKKVLRSYNDNYSYWLLDNVPIP